MKGFSQLVKNIRPSKWGWLLTLTSLIFSLFILTFIEVIHRGSFTAFLDWVQQSTVSFSITLFFLFLIVEALLFLPNWLFIPLIIFELIFWIIVSFGSHEKFLLRGEYFTPADLYLVNEGADISKLINGLIGWKEIAGAIGIIFILIIFNYFFIRFKKKVSFTNRLLISVVSIICLTIIINQPSIFSIRSYSKEVETVESYNKFGFIGAYLTLWEKAKNAEPDEYDKAEINHIVTELGKSKKDATDPNFKPNVIVVLAEAMWDPLLLKNITFKEDPLPYVRSLMEKNSSGVLLTHTYGGGTIHTEMEILTGLSTRFSPQEVYYNQINRPIDSLAYEFRNQGYHTTAVHDFKNWYYGRNELYRWIGFEKFVSMEFLNNPNYIGPFMDDRVLMKQALAELNQTKGPDFLNVVTVVSHGPYTDKRYEKLPELTSSNMTESSKYILNLYTNLLKELDDSVRTLIEGVKKTGEPTMVVIYGDHLPFLGENNAVYREAGYFNGDLSNHDQYKKMYQTPLLVWDNFNDSSPKEDLRMTPNFLGSYILAHAKKEMSPIFKVNRDVYNQGITVIPRRDFYEIEGVKEGALHNFQLLQYDALNGNQYSYRNLGIKPADDYLLGSGKMKINSLNITKENNGSYVLDIRGKNLVSSANVYIDGNIQETKFISGNHVSVVIAKDSLEKATPHKVIVKLLDDRKAVIAKTNTKNIVID